MDPKNKPEIFLNHYYKKLNELNVEIKFIRENKNSFLSDEFVKIILEEKEELKKMYLKKINQYETYRQNLTGKEKDNGDK